MTAADRLQCYQVLEHLPKRTTVRSLARRTAHAGHIPLLSVAAGNRKAWTLADWEALLADLDACDDTISDWLAIRS